MKERGRIAYKQALKEIPVRCYERLNKETLAVLSIALCFGLVATDTIKIGEPLPHLMGGAVYLLSAIVDDKSTLAVFKANDKALQESIDHPLREDNVTSVDTYIVEKKKTLAIQGAATVISVIFPQFGIGFAVGKTLAAISNRRLEKRINRAVELVTVESTGNSSLMK